ncbi:hypothetical protein CROQUDRAFT_134302 [Cronartium quercuum f. sp. fusiforme G11]|uniref:Uncharacterized protein n=1 Tax=Cronartium quercuum f. sp. fusiforme G11 TaxID=708437 RepID=A0A9P6TAE4_9BASI|nr:hypothetical protein CROQUDRAFT_134302 [Cronartium quercuum f. sp. fusiforme G11]
MFPMLGTTQNNHKNKNKKRVRLIEPTLSSPKSITIIEPELTSKQITQTKIEIVISFITRGHPHKPNDANQEHESLTLEDLSKRSIDRHLPKLDYHLDLKLIRQSYKLKWDHNTHLVVFLYKLINSNQDDDEKLGKHHWQVIKSVWFPIGFNVGYEELSSNEINIRPDLSTLKALDTFYLSIQAGYGRDAIIEHLKSDQSNELYSKLRVWTYWTQVICYHLIRSKPVSQVSISFSINKVLASVKPLVMDEKICLEELEKRIVESIGKEAGRCKEANEKLIDHAINQLIQLIPNDQKSLHLFTIGSSTATYGLLSNLVGQVIGTSHGIGNGIIEPLKRIKLTISECQPFNEGIILASKISQLIPTNKKPKQIKKMKKNNNLNKVKSNSKISLNSETELDLHSLYILPEHANSITTGIRNFIPYEFNDSIGDVSINGRLPDLLAQIDRERAQVVPLPPVEIEIVSDAAFASIIPSSSSSSSSTPILLLAADRILPNGDAVCKSGSLYAAYTAQNVGGKVIVLTRLDRIHPTHLPSRPQTSDRGSRVRTDAMVLGWKTLLRPELVDKLQVETGKEDDTWDTVSAELVSFYVTELGVIEVGKVRQISETLRRLDKLIWEDEDEIDDEISLGINDLML